MTAVSPDGAVEERGVLAAPVPLYASALVPMHRGVNVCSPSHTCCLMPVRKLVIHRHLGKIDELELWHSRKNPVGEQV